MAITRRQKFHNNFGHNQQITAGHIFAHLPPITDLYVTAANHRSQV